MSSQDKADSAGDEPWDSKVCQRLLEIVADAAKENAPLSHAAVERALGMLTGIYAAPNTLCATPSGTLVARWDGGLVLEIGPDWEMRLVNGTTKPTLGPPRLFIEVQRELGSTGAYMRSRKEISLLLWRSAHYGADIVEAEINACLRETESYDR